MGFQVAWLAIKDVSPQKIHDFYDVEASGESDVIPDDFEIAGVQLSSSWYLIHFDDFMPKELSESKLIQLSHLGEVISCRLHEGVMMSMATSYKNGRKEWSVQHDAQKSATHIKSQGDLPSDFNATLDNAALKQKERKDVDYYFDVPIDLAEGIVGYRYGRARNKEQTSFQELE